MKLCIYYQKYELLLFFPPTFYINDFKNNSSILKKNNRKQDFRHNLCAYFFVHLDKRD